MIQINMSDELAHAIRDLLRRRGWLEAAIKGQGTLIKGQGTLKSANTLTAFALFVVTVASSCVGSILDEPAAPLPEQDDLVGVTPVVEVRPAA